IIDNKKVTLTFTDNFPEAILLTLSVSGVEDDAGNAIALEEAQFSYYTVQQYDVLIDEIFADETPVIGLPEAEYLELYNTTSLDIDLAGWKIKDATDSTDAFSTFLLEPNAYVIITDDANISLFTSYGEVIGINNFPSLNNDGDLLSLYNNNYQLIHNVNYSTDWYKDAIKEEGGYSLEMIDTNNPCQGIENWMASDAVIGGTPGTINSVDANNPDEIAPSIISAFPSAEDSLIIYFDEAIELNSVDAADFIVDNGIGIAISAEIENTEPTVIKLFFTNPFSSNILYTVTCSGITDCSGNEVLLNNTAQFGIPETADFDIVINEILFNPVTNGFDYIELYNRSDKFISMSDLSIAEFDLNDTASIDEITQISANAKLFLPGTYVLITENINQIASTYFISNTDNFIENNNTPNYPDDEGIVALLDANGNTIDRLHFYDDWHFALLDDENGVSLERLNYNAATQDINNWHSAAEDKHFGTPGYQNSVFGEIGSGENLINLEYDVFSPDGDAYHDYLIINYNSPAAGYVANVSIFDAQGRKIKELSNNNTISAEGFFTWDGLNEDSDKAKMGIYIVYAELFNLEGTIEKEKLKCTLVRK
ncbi:MAG: lamin tail domain-containing protein, partial [Fimbriimonadaceae bacterium]|nr:lamin tail domain-containing protein [Chitinophagales bacterium]